MYSMSHTLPRFQKSTEAIVRVYTCPSLFWHLSTDLDFCALVLFTSTSASVSKLPCPLITLPFSHVLTKDWTCVKMLSPAMTALLRYSSSLFQWLKIFWYLFIIVWHVLMWLAGSVYLIIFESRLSPFSTLYIVSSLMYLATHLDLKLSNCFYPPNTKI